MRKNSHRMIITRALIGMALYWPLWKWNIQLIDYGPMVLCPLGKLLFYINLFYMLVNWYLIANRKPEVDRSTLKFGLFIILILVLMELHTLIYAFQQG